MINKIKKNYINIIVTLLPIVMIFVGYKIFKDYGISIDENITRYNGLVSTKYIINFLSLEKYYNLDLFKDVVQLKDWSDKQYGTIFEIIQVFFIEIFLNIREYSQIYYSRHLANHYLFLLSIFCFYFLCLNIFHNKFNFFSNKRRGPPNN